MIKAKQNKTVKKPNAFLFYIVGLMVKLYNRYILGQSIDKSAIMGIKPPYLVVANHSCWLDYMITAVSMYPVRMNYVAAYNFFRNRILSKVFHLMGAISKYQFTNDLVAVKEMKSVTRRGGVVAIFPNGCLSNEGRPGGYAVFGIAKLIKFLDVPVIAIQTNGGYLTRPRWTKHARYGKLETTVKPILTASDIHELTESEIYKKVIEAIQFDDYQWQREKRIRYKSRKPAEGLEYVLYKCPKCEGEFTLCSEGNRFFCTSCGNAVRMNQQLFFEPENENAVYFDGIDKWYDFQKEHLEKEIESPDFQLTAQTELQWAEPGKFGYQHLGYGTVRLTRDSITYSGLVNGQEKTLVYPMKSIPMVPYAAGEYIEVAKKADINRFVFKNLKEQIKWVMAIRQIRDKYYEQSND